MGYNGIFMYIYIYRERYIYIHNQLDMTFLCQEMGLCDPQMASIFHRQIMTQFFLTFTNGFRDATPLETMVQ